MESARILQKKTVPVAMVNSTSLTLITAPTAAITEPPQIAVPAELSPDSLEGRCSALPRKAPSRKVRVMQHNANSGPLHPALMPDILAIFRKKYPDIDLTLEIANTKTIQSQLLESRLDVGLTEGYAEQEHLISSVFMRDRLVAITSSDHPFASWTAITAKEFCAEPFLLREPGSGTRAVVERSLAEIGINSYVSTLIRKRSSD